MKDYRLLIKYYLFGRPWVTVTAVAFLICMLAILYVTTREIKPTISELQLQIKTQIDNANSGITLQQSIATKEIQKAQDIITTMSSCNKANQELKDYNNNLTLDAFASGLQPKKAIDCKDYKIKNNTEANLKIDINASTVKAKTNYKVLLPDELLLTANKADGCDISQTPDQHYKANKRFAYDVACKFGTSEVKAFTAYAPDYLDKPVTYTVTKKYTDKFTGNTLELSFTGTNNVPTKWVIGHVTSTLSIGNKVATGQPIGVSDMSGLTTGFHNHVEIWMNGVNFDYTTRSKVLENERYNVLQSFKWGDKVYFTHYTLGDKRQNDSSPCSGASSKDLCQLARQGIKTIALTVDVRKSLGIKFGDTIELAGPCSGQYQVHDEKAKRFRYSCIKEQGYCNKGDIATEIGHRDMKGKLVIDFTSVPNCNGGVHTLVRKINT